MLTPKAVIRKRISWMDYQILGFDLEELRAGRYSWWANFVKKYSEIQIDLYDCFFDITLKEKGGTVTTYKQMMYSHMKVKMTEDKDILLLVDHDVAPRIYMLVLDSDIVKGTWRDVMRCYMKRAPRGQCEAKYANYIF